MATVQGHPDGFGFLVPDDGGDDLFLSPREMHKVLHGDRATARASGVDRRGRPEGEIVEVLERANREVVGRLHEERGVSFVVAENRRINQDLLVPPDERGAREVRRGRRRRDRRAAVARSARRSRASIEVLGSATDPGHRDRDRAAQARAAVRVLARRRSGRRSGFPTEVRPADRKGRVDLTALPLVTIDGETAKDFDDAVYCERKGKGFRLVVAIADVSHYVRDGDAIDHDARERGTSVYFPRRVIPMLPEELSNELCSLKPRRRPPVHGLRHGDHRAGRDRGATRSTRRSCTRARASPTRRSGRGCPSPRRRRPREAKALLPHLQRSVRAVPGARSARASKRGAIDFDTVELALVFDEHGKIAAIVPAPRNDAHKLIEECMLAANVCAADFLAKREHPALYRVHEGPTPEKLAALREFLATLARCTLGGGDDPTAADYAKLLDADQRPARLRAAADRAAALAVAGAVPARQRRPLRPRVRGVRALHLADPPLSRPARAPRDQGGARAASATRPQA